MEENQLSGQLVLTFKYNQDSIRTSNTSQGVEHKYTLNGSQILAEEWGAHLAIYLYDESGSPIGMQYRNTTYAADVFDTYYFEKNLQGDIIAVYTDAGRKIGSYTYDAWGNVTVSYASGATMAEKRIVRNFNPFRYRGYYYDIETGLYYLQSRYYDPAAGRFIGLDNSSVILASPYALTDKNLYAYCDNNPVMRIDEDGDFWGTLIVKVLVGVASQYVGDVIENVAQGKTGKDIFYPTSSVGEYIAAGVTAIIPGNGLGGALVRSIVSEKINRVEAVLTGKEISYSESLGNIVSSTIMDTAFSFASSKVDDLIGKLDPPEYSTYARQTSQKKPGIRRKQIRFRRKARIFGVRSLQELAGIGFDLGQSHVGGIVDEIGG